MSVLPALASAPACLAAPAHWRVIDFMADLHLAPGEPGTFEAWRDCLARTQADALFILGDLFEVWVGDDAILSGSFEAGCIEALRQASRRLSIHFMPGNRDFLIGPACLAAAGMALLADPTALHFGAGAYLLTHGDLLCTGDADYQRYRAQVRAPAAIRDFLALPLANRQTLARQMRAQSQAHQAARTEYADVDAAAALSWLEAADAATLIHGHTHQPGDHALGAACRRYALSDWNVTATRRRAQILRLHADGRAERLPPEAA
jgi:UDP-2,3-diacylglucosamine hydrolase